MSAPFQWLQRGAQGGRSVWCYAPFSLSRPLSVILLHFFPWQNMGLVAVSGLLETRAVFELSRAVVGACLPLTFLAFAPLWLVLEAGQFEESWSYFSFASQTIRMLESGAAPRDMFASLLGGRWAQNSERSFRALALWRFQFQGACSR